LPRFAIFLFLSAAVNGVVSDPAHNRRFCAKKSNILSPEIKKKVEIELYPTPKFSEGFSRCARLTLLFVP